jgi:hypothetical protein
MLTHCCVQSGNPEGTEDAFFVATVTVGVLTSTHDRLFGNTKYITATATKAFGCVNNFLVTGTSGDTTFYARHVLSPLNQA